MFGLTPFNRSNLTRTNEDFYSMIDDFFNNNMSPIRGLRNDSFKIDVRENEKEFLIDAELPGFQKEDLQLNIYNKQLVISVNKEEKIDEETDIYVHRERKCSSMKRSIYLPNIKEEGISAKFENGILSIIVPKVEPEVKKSQIEIQ